jgi:hypothetical protein
LQKSFFIFGREVQFVGKELERDGAVELEVESFVDDSHAAYSGGAEDLVLSNLLVDG